MRITLPLTPPTLHIMASENSDGAQFEGMDCSIAEPVKPDASQSVTYPDHTSEGRFSDSRSPLATAQTPGTDNVASLPIAREGCQSATHGGGEWVPPRRKREREVEEGESDAVEKRAAEEGLSWWTCLLLGVGQERSKPQVVRKLHHNYK